MYVCMHVCMYMYVCMHACIDVYTCTIFEIQLMQLLVCDLTHTHTHTYQSSLQHSILMALLQPTDPRPLKTMQRQQLSLKSEYAHRHTYILTYAYAYACLHMLLGLSTYIHAHIHAPQADEMSAREKRRQTEKCVACGKTALDVQRSRLFKCSVCTIAPKYCSAECQAACWPSHKAECKANRNT